MRRFPTVALVSALLAACKPAAQTSADASNELNQRPRLPTGAHLDPVARASDVGAMPLAMTLSPEGNQIVVLLNGWREQAIQVLDRRTDQVAQTLLQPATFLGIAFSPDGRRLYVAENLYDSVAVVDVAAKRVFGDMPQGDGDG